MCLKRKKPAESIGNTNKRKHTPVKREIKQPTRVSARLRGKSPDKNIERENSAVEDDNRSKTIDSLDEQNHKKLLRTMERTLLPNTEPMIKTEDDVDDKAIVDQLNELKIHHDWVTVKVTPNRINGCLQIRFHPSNTKILGCAIDVEGYLGFWDINEKEENEDPVVYNYRPHTRTVTDIKFDPLDPSKLLTSSYDGNIRIFDMNKAEFETLDTGSEKYPITSFDIQQDGHLIWFSTSDGEVGCVDKRTGGAPTVYQPREKKVGCIHINPVHQEMLAVGSNDRTATIWDIRNLRKGEPLYSFDHGYAVTSCYWSPKGDILATSSYDDYIRLFQLNEQKDMQLKSAIPHNNHTGRWVTNFRARWNTNRYHGLEHQHLAIGNMNQTVDIYSGESGKEMTQIYDQDHITAIPSVAQFHPNTLKPTILTGNASDCPSLGLGIF
ncbi:hypothetical protein G6F47_012331 [Rhizopus delemar]|nr:hypothetical protein G6F54_011968 [Rhizopus delemar]KAG1497100.1 hypothetical protein G6F53_012043 [Rhizopus delemar]KAG1581933.1 hypothetical protein G6F47_012331 [Rhizopus delemar]